MTFEERLAALGVDISDLPDYDKKLDVREKAILANSVVRANAENERFSVLGIIIRLTDIIDRIETRLDNVIGEREYLLDRMWGENPCVICENAKRYGGCAVDICEFEFAGVPEDWRAHDD